ncbi:hypothetical protein COEREDRAFT_83302 [Coemansia reversa NRRL 1564]|uniref:ApaG domain-containing protein n=1 Tax=Coemansia reversa (strain ATCC 12441 / NRRL 1564) TaxID=763665 RepID=A0A2G5B3Y3_COERN|nr:hypothetical protein COEREDRAFT_83302 [Coemansia reversa NRRL 1564]|eukprot:PIA13705.1 hypothetical protein COEREDRAFT_83302 [Coemansia reversa NRRL 1564]
MLQNNLVNVAEEQVRAHKQSNSADVRGLATVCKNKRLFANWHDYYRGFTDSYTRMRKAFDRLEIWAESSSPVLLQSLGTGLGWMSGVSVPVRELLEVVNDSPAMRDFIMAHHFHDGQRRQRRFLGVGLFGSYECYGEVCSLSWLSSRMLQVIAMGQFRILVFAWCHVTRNYLGMVVDCPPTHCVLMHHVIQIQPRSYRFVDKGLFGEFFTAYIEELVAGHHDVHDGVINMMPNYGPHTGISVMRGIRTTVSAMFCFDETSSFHVYRYQVTFEIVNPEELGFSSVQLESRHWLVHYSNQEHVHVNGAGVVGEFPLISVDEPYFRYCSRVQDEPEGLMVVGFEGYFTMVPGTLDEPKGTPFNLPVPYIELPIPMEII